MEFPTHFQCGVVLERLVDEDGGVGALGGRGRRGRRVGGEAHLQQLLAVRLLLGPEVAAGLERSRK